MAASLIASLRTASLPQTSSLAQDRPESAASQESVKALDAAGYARWDAFVAASPEATFFHRAAWRDVIADSFGHRTHYLYAERDGEVTGVLPLTEIRSLLFGHGLIGNAFSVCGAPAAADEAARAALVLQARELLESCGANYIEFRAPAKPRPDWQTRSGLYAGFEGPLPADEDANLKQIPRKQRAVVRKAIDSRLTWRVDDDVDTLHHLYAVSVRNLGTPVFPKRYFANLVRRFAPDCDILTVESDGQPMASVLNFYFKDRVMPFYTGSLPAARKLGANDLMYWRLMRHASTRGCTAFDFGRSKVGTGPYEFKKNWGFAPQPIVHQFWTKAGVAMPNINPLNPKYRLMIAAWKRLPLSVANQIGPFIVRNIG